MGRYYRKHFLHKVIARVDLASSVLEFPNGLPKAISERVLPTFPIAEPKPREVYSTQFEVPPRGAGQPATTTERHWLLHGRDKDKTLVIAPNHFYIEVNRYSSFKELSGELECVLDAVAKHLPEMQITRFGLRYINAIKPADSARPMEWGDLINSKLLSSFRFPRNGAEVCRAFSTLTFRADDALLVMQYGMHNEDYPAPIRKKVFIIDLDAYYAGALSPDAVKQRSSRFHDWIEKTFESAILDGLRAMMDVSNEPPA